MLEGIPGTAHTLPLLIFHGILHKKVQIHLTAWELFVHVEMALQPWSLFKPSLFFNSKVLFTGVENSTLHNLCAQPADYWCSNLSPALSAKAGGLLILEEVCLHIVGCFQTTQAIFSSGYVRHSKGELSPLHRQHHALADHSSRSPERDFSDHFHRWLSVKWWVRPFLVKARNWHF